MSWQTATFFEFPNKKASSFTHYEERLSSVRQHIPSHRFGEPEELAQAILFLASQEASYINGIVLPVDSALSVREAGPVIK